MLSDDLRQKLREMMVKDPKEAVKLLEKDPQILRILLNSDEEKVKYINMTAQMEQQLKQKAAELQTTQGYLIGAGIALFLTLLAKD